jgi:alpha-N-arabinofuranosidase
VDGFHFLHAAANWAPPVIPLQTGAVGPRMGKRWIIQNCTVVNARCVGIILGQAPGVDYEDIEAFGDHVVRNNVIRRCGQAGIAGQKGATRSLITGNLIEETNYRREFGGWETAAIKFHNSVDTVISNNLIRGVFRQKEGAFGIWMDFGNQGTRITGNVICDTEAETIFLEMDHGPMLIDNNVLLGGGVEANSENMVFAHNLFVDCPYRDQIDWEQRRSQFYTPHTTRVVGHKPGLPANNQWYNNLFIRHGLHDVKGAPGYRADYNAFLEGARPATFGDAHSAVAALAVGLRREDSASGILLVFQMNEAPLGIQAPRVDAGMVGVFPTVGQTLEDCQGRPIGVTADLAGRRFEPPVPGPLATLQAGENRLSWQRSPAPPVEAR